MNKRNLSKNFFREKLFIILTFLIPILISWSNQSGNFYIWM